MNRLDQPQTESQQQQLDKPSLEEAIGRYQRILRRTFDQTRAGRLVEAGGSLIEISEWLVTNARDLGKMHPFFSSPIFLISYCFCFCFCFLSPPEKTEEHVSTVYYECPRIVAQKSHSQLDPSFSVLLLPMFLSLQACIMHKLSDTLVGLQREANPSYLIYRPPP
jgi:hypothetical protein